MGCFSLMIVYSNNMGSSKNCNMGHRATVMTQHRGTAMGPKRERLSSRSIPRQHSLSSSSLSRCHSTTLDNSKCSQASTCTLIHSHSTVINSPRMLVVNNPHSSSNMHSSKRLTTRSTRTQL